jgi:hypothetical protein
MTSIAIRHATMADSKQIAQLVTDLARWDRRAENLIRTRECVINLPSQACRPRSPRRVAPAPPLHVGVREADAWDDDPLVFNPWS